MPEEGKRRQVNERIHNHGGNIMDTGVKGLAIKR
jgi:hypothetical protein